MTHCEWSHADTHADRTGSIHSYSSYSLAVRLLSGRTLSRAEGLDHLVKRFCRCHVFKFGVKEVKQAILLAVKSVAILSRLIRILSEFPRWSSSH